MREVYFNPHSSRKKEHLFFNQLIENYPMITHIKENYRLPSLLLNNKINVREIEGQLLDFDKISHRKKQSVLESLSILPNEVFVAKTIADVSVDYVFIDENNETVFIEFHEKQHKNLSGSRMTPIFDEIGNRFEIPRYTQRLLKDIWRCNNLDNYKIVWWDWFETNRSVTLEELLKSSKNEFHLENKFSFNQLLQE